MMSTKIEIEEPSAKVNVKHERFYTPISHNNQTEVVNAASSQDDKLKIVNDLLIGNTPTNENMKYRMERAKLYYETGKYTEALADINVIESNFRLPNHLLALKMKVSLKIQFELARQCLAKTIEEAPVEDNTELLELLERYSEQNIHKAVDGAAGPRKRTRPYCNTNKRK